MVHSKKTESHTFILASVKILKLMTPHQPPTHKSIIYALKTSLA